MENAATAVGRRLVGVLVDDTVNRLSGVALGRAKGGRMDIVGAPKERLSRSDGLSERLSRT
jgi:hypothetical protein